jgi:HEAT repeat protein
MKYLLAGTTLVLFCLALADNSDAGGKKGDKSAIEVPPRADEIPKYMKMLTGSSAKDRATAAHKIGLRGIVNATDVLDAIDPLRSALEKDTDAAVRKEAARALGNIQPDPKDTVPLLTKTVKDDKVLDVRLAATVALGQYGAEAKDALPVLRDFAGEIKDKKAPAGQTISAAIKMISGKKK